jgi:hypothetical protein
MKDMKKLKSCSEEEIEIAKRYLEANTYLEEAIKELERITGKKIPMPVLLPSTRRDSSNLRSYIPGSSQSIQLGSYDPILMVIRYQSELGSEKLEKTIYHEALHHAANILCKDLYKLPDKEIYPYAFSLWSTLVGAEANFIEEGMAKFFAAAYTTKDKSEFPGDIFFRYFMFEDLFWSWLYTYALETDKAVNTILEISKK